MANNKVGDDAPDAATSAQLLAQLQQIVDTWKKYGLVLSKDERQGLLHARLGAEQHIERVHDLALKYKVDIEGIPLQGMANDLALYTALRPFQDLFRAGLTLVNDTAGQAESEAWEAFLAYYGTLSGMAKHQPALAAELAAVVEFMKTGPRKPAADKATAGTKATTTSAPTANGTPAAGTTSE